MNEERIITTEDGVQIRELELAYNYYDMKLGWIMEGTIEENGGDLWFKFEHMDGSRSILNGARVCSYAYAKRRGFKGIAEYEDEMREGAREVEEGRREREEFYRNRDYADHTGRIRFSS